MKLFRCLLENRVGLGYYPVHKAENIAEKRKGSRAHLRAELFSKHELRDTGQKILVYCGGNNKEYFEEAFPAFLSFLSKSVENQDLSKFLIVLQQHPEARRNQKIDGTLMKESIQKYAGVKNAPSVILSDASTDDMLVTTDAVLCYQTSMAPLIALAGIPLIQVGHKTYEDIVVKTHLCPSVTNFEDFVKEINTIEPKDISDKERDNIHKSLGINKDWVKAFKQALVQGGHNISTPYFKQ